MNCKKQALNWNGRARAKGVWPPGGYSPGRPGQGQQLAGLWLTPSAYWNEDPWRRWLSHANVGPAIIDGMKTACLNDNGACVNLVTPEFVKSRGLGVGSIQDLNDHNGCIPLSGYRGSATKPLGYVVIRVQILYVPSFNEDQVALVVVDDSHFIRQCPVLLGTPTINQAIWVMKESELENAPKAWQSAQHLYEFANYMVQVNLDDYGITIPTNTGQNPTDLDEIVFLKKKITIPAFETAILHCRTHW